jgi:hypothetical protein
MTIGSKGISSPLVPEAQFDADAALHGIAVDERAPGNILDGRGLNR